ncbi:hypothetical protein DMJ13_13590 [halophilic archaeon]|nr:hypothetical protein DMJ13_13590 [halophilic archaeon]
MNSLRTIVVLALVALFALGIANVGVTGSVLSDSETIDAGPVSVEDGTTTDSSVAATEGNGPNATTPATTTATETTTVDEPTAETTTVAATTTTTARTASDGETTGTTGGSTSG